MTPEPPQAHRATLGPLVTCHRCGIDQPASEFHVNRRRANGLTDRCKSCSRVYYQAKRDRIIEYARQHRWEDARVRMASDARRSDRRHRRESDIKAKDIVIPRACPVTGKPIYHGYGVRMAWSPCLERIDKSRGFVKGNWRVVSWEAVEASGMVDKPSGVCPGLGAA